MKSKFGKKIKIFWDIHKYEILFWLGLAATCATAVAVGDHLHNVKEKRRQEAEAAWESQRKLLEEEAAHIEEDRKADPLNTVTSGGDIADYYDCSCGEYDMAEFIINDIPISSMGEFGKNIVEISKERFPDLGEFDTAQMILELRHSEPMKEEDEDGNSSD